MVILIIGAKGFLGSHLAEYFLSRGDKVYSSDISKNDNDDPSYFQINVDLPDYDSLFQHNEFDCCINCSGAANVSNSFTNRFFDFTANTINVFKILDSLQRYNANCKFLNLSSAAVYGNPKIIPVAETNDLCPISPYGFHKRIAEEVLSEFYEIWKLRTCSVRIFSAYGNGLKKQICYDLAQKIKNDKEITLFGTGEETRDFIHVKDICQAIDCIVRRGEFKNSIINIGNGEQISIRQLANIMLKEWGVSKNIKFSGVERSGDPLKWEASISVLSSLGYKKNVPIEEGLRSYVEWVKKEI